MTGFTQRFLASFFSAVRRMVMLALVLTSFGASMALAQTKGYVTNAFDNTVSVIDTATNTVTATIPVGPVPIALAVTPNGSFVYVGNQNNSTVSVISTATNSVTVGLLPQWNSYHSEWRLCLCGDSNW